MATQTPPFHAHRHTRSAVIPASTASLQNPQNPHYLNLQAQTTNPNLSHSRSGMDASHQQPTTPPITPQKADNSGPSRNGPPVAESASKLRSKGKTRPKNVMTSPSNLIQDRSTPPLTGVHAAPLPFSKPISTPSTAAYAGPTFHASPAPSALPIPSFYSKSVPDSPAARSLSTRIDDASSGGCDSPTPPTARNLATQTQRQDSPLDFFFKADREEKARARSTNSYRDSNARPGPFQPPPDSPQTYTTPPHAAPPRSDGSNGRGSASGMFVMELDGTNSPSKPYGPAFSTPYAERINAARSGVAPPDLYPQYNVEQQRLEDRSEALKAYLFSGLKVNSPRLTTADTGESSTPNTPFRSSSTPLSGPRIAGLPPRQFQNSSSSLQDSHNASRSGSRSSGLRQEVTPTKTPVQTPERGNIYRTENFTQSRMPVNDSPSARGLGENVIPQHSSSNAVDTQSGAQSVASNTDLRGMEDSLRRILKLEPSAGSGVQGAGKSSVPVASVSIPVSNHVGGRSAPLNGVNGVLGSRY